MNGLPELLEAISFAAQKHRYQRRKGADAEPYINHPLEVASLLANIGGISNKNILIAAVLHDTIEDTDTSADEIALLFGNEVSTFVLEVTDDTSLNKQVRKQKQVEHAPHLSPGAKQIKLADKISNIRDILEKPPTDWSENRKLEYIEWGTQVVAGLRGINSRLEEYFDQLVTQAKTSRL